MLYAAFQILEDFIEREHPWEFTATDEEVYVRYTECCEEMGRKRQAIWATISELYHWWKEVKNDPNYDNEVNYEQNNTMLHKLIDVRGYLRGYLWT